MKSEITPADRVGQIQEYYFSRKLREVAALKAAGHDIISLAIGGPDLPPSDAVIDTLTENARHNDAHGYQPTTGTSQLRRAFSEWYKKWYGVELDPDSEIQPLIGSKEGVLQISLTFLNPGDGVLVPNPGYPTYTSASRLAQAHIYSYDLKPETGWYPDFNELEKLPLDKIKLMWVNYPHMPTGTRPTRKLFERLIEFGKVHGIVIVHDNPYSFILNDNPMSILQIPGAKEIAIEMNSMSKSHNMPGWRVAMLASNPTFVSWVLKVKSNIDSGQFLPVMNAAVKGLEAPAEWYEKVNDTYRSRRKVAEEIMTALNCSFDPKQSGLFLWGRIPDSADSSENFADNLLKNKEIFITPGFIFGSNGDRYIRISLCAPIEKLKEALERIKS